MHYWNSDSNAPTAGARNVRTTVSDGDGGISANADVTVTVSSINDDPTITSLPTDITVTEDTASDVDLSAATLADADAGANSITLTIAAGAGTLSATTSGGVTVGGSGTASLTLSGVVADIDIFLNTASNIQYTGAGNAFGNDVTTLSLTANDGGNTGSGGGTDVSLGTVNVDITAVADTPSVTNAATDEDTQIAGGLVITKNAADGAEVTHFKITGIVGGTLFKNDGTTPIIDNDFITVAEGGVGLKFTPSANSFSNGSFNVQAGTDGVGGGLSPVSATATITVNPVGDTPSVTNATTDEDTQSSSGLVISRNGVDSTEVTHFKITNITGGTLYQNDGTTAIVDNAFITFAQGNAGLKFTPTANSTSPGSFDVQAGTDNVGGGLSAGSATATVTVTAVADTPSVTNATTNEDTQSTSGLVISRNGVDGAEVTHFKITGISGGTLYKNDGTTTISDNDFITFAEGNAGLKFTPTANSTSPGSFDVRAGTDGVGGGLSTVSAVATITVTPVNDPPILTNLNGDSVSFSIGGNAVALDAGADATLSDIDSTDFSGGKLTASIVANGQTAEDVLLVGTVGNIGTSGTDVTHTDGVTIGTYSGGTGGFDLVVTLNANATVARVRDLISALQYWDNNAATVNTATRTVRMIVDDGDGGSSTSFNQDISVTLLRAPIIDLDGDDSSGGVNGGYLGSFTEDGGAVMTADTDSTISDDGTYKSLTVTLTNRPDSADESLSSTYGTGSQSVNSEAVTIVSYNSGTGELLITVDDGSTDDITIALLMASIRYNNTSNTPDSALRSVTYSAVDNDDNAGAVSTALISVTPVNDPLTGSAVITGGSTPPVVGETLTADASGITDADGLGVFSYQWKRNDIAISGATADTYLLANADSGSAVSVTVSYTDLGGTDESTTSAATSNVDGDLDSDGIGDASDPDIDGDGMTNVYEDANGLNKRMRRIGIAIWMVTV